MVDDGKPWCVSVVGLCSNFISSDIRAICQNFNISQLFDGAHATRARLQFSAAGRELTQWKVNWKGETHLTDGCV